MSLIRYQTQGLAKLKNGVIKYGDIQSGDVLKGDIRSGDIQYGNRMVIDYKLLIVVTNTQDIIHFR
jgi:hypothetical protein